MEGKPDWGSPFQPRHESHETGQMSLKVAPSALQDLVVSVSLTPDGSSHCFASVLGTDVLEEGSGITMATLPCRKQQRHFEPLHKNCLSPRLPCVLHLRGKSNSPQCFVEAREGSRILAFGSETEGT